MSSVTDPWSKNFDYVPSSRAASPLLQNPVGGDSQGGGAGRGALPDGSGTSGNMNIDTELASIVSSLSALSNPGFHSSSSNLNAMNTGNVINESSISSFRRSSFASDDGGLVLNSSTNNNSTTNNQILTRKSPLSLGTIPMHTNNNGTLLGNNAGNSILNRNSSNNKLNILGQYSASINGPLLFTSNNSTTSNSTTTTTNSNATTGGRGGFFEKFGRSLIDGTRELENTYNHNTFGNEEFISSDNTTTGSFADTTAAEVLTASPSSASTTSTTTASSTNYLNDGNTTVGGIHTTNDNSANVHESARRNIWNMANIPVFKPERNNNGNNNQPDHMFPYPPTGSIQQPSNPMLLPNNNPYFFMESPCQYAPVPGAPLPPPIVPTGANNAKVMNTNPLLQDPQQMPATNASQTLNIRNPYYNRTKKPSGMKNKPKHVQSNPYLDNHKGSTKLAKKTDKTTANKNLSTALPQDNTSSKQSGSTSNDRFTHKHMATKSSPQYQRSALLEEFRNSTKEQSYTLKNIFGYMVEFCKDQHGSRFIQHQLAMASPSEREVVFNEIRDHILELADDVFGNYVIQKFFEYGSPTQIKVMAEQFKGRMKELSMQMYACRVIQRALEAIELETRIELVMELVDNVLPMIKDQNGNHVIQKAIERIPIANLPFILNSLTGQIYHLSTHAYGCRVIQRLLEFGTADDQTRILEELDDFIPYLIQDQYGNYVIQYILQQKVDSDAETGDDNDKISPHMAETKQVIVDMISSNVVEFSKHKFASNVVEKAVVYGDSEQKKLIMSKILPRNAEHAANLEDNAPIILMMRDQFANYVVQKLVGVSKGADKKLIVIAIRAYLDKLNSSNSLGNRHLASVEKLATLVESVEI